MQNQSLLLTITAIIVILISVYYYSKRQQIEIIENRKFNVLEDWESSKIISEIENKYMLWNNNGEREMLEQPFEGYIVKILKKIPIKLEKGDMIYFPKTFKVSWPMFYKEENDKSGNNYYYPKPNSMIIVENTLTWEGKDEPQVVIFGKKISGSIKTTV